MLQNLTNQLDSRSETGGCADFCALNSQLFRAERPGETLIVPVRRKVGDLASIYSSFKEVASLIWQLLELLVADGPWGR